MVLLESSTNHLRKEQHLHQMNFQKTEEVTSQLIHMFSITLKLKPKQDIYRNEKHGPPFLVSMGANTPHKKIQSNSLFKRQYILPGRVKSQDWKVGLISDT